MIGVMGINHLNENAKLWYFLNPLYHVMSEIAIISSLKLQIPSSAHM